MINARMSQFDKDGHEDTIVIISSKFATAGCHTMLTSVNVTGDLACFKESRCSNVKPFNLFTQSHTSSEYGHII